LGVIVVLLAGGLFEALGVTEIGFGVIDDALEEDDVLGSHVTDGEELADFLLRELGIAVELADGRVEEGRNESLDLSEGKYNRAAFPENRCKFVEDKLAIR
jgi:hypothetical protein